MRIRSIKLFTADLPLAIPFEHASSGRIAALNEVVLRLEDEDGQVGYGEVRGNVHYVTGDSPGRVTVVLRELILPQLMGIVGWSPRLVVEAMDRIVVGNSSAKALVDAAIHDLLGKRLGVPVHVLLGGRVHDLIHVHATLPFEEAEATARRAVAYLDRGFRLLKLRVGLRPFARDLARARAVRDAVAGHAAGAETTLACDANQGWQVKEAIANMRRLAEFGIAFIEQPVAASDVVGLAAVKRALEIPVFADESCGTPEELIRLIREEAADGFHFKLCKAGGLVKLMKMVAIAEAAGRPYIIGQMDEGMLATAAAIHCGFVSRAKSFELWGFERVGSQPFRGIEMCDAAIPAPERPGFGVEVDEAGLDLVAEWKVER